MPKLKVNGIDIYYEEYGRGKPIVFISGFSADHSSWDSMAKSYFSDYRVVVFDNRGVGQSDCPHVPYTAELLATDTAELCRALDIRRAYFVGNSMGGMIVAMLAYKYPDLVEAAVISNSVIKLESFVTRYQLLLDEELELLRESVFSEAFTKENLRWIFSKSFLSQPGMMDILVKFQTENKHPMTADGFISQRNISDTFDATAWLRNITCPCLVIGSDGDRIYPEEKVRALACAIPRAQYYCFNGGMGHLPYVGQPDKFSRVVIGFISKLSDSMTSGMSSKNSVEEGTAKTPRPSRA